MRLYYRREKFFFLFVFLASDNTDDNLIHNVHNSQNSYIFIQLSHQWWPEQ